MCVFELLVCTAAADHIGTAKKSNNLLPCHARFEPRHIFSPIVQAEKRETAERATNSVFTGGSVYQKQWQVGKVIFRLTRAGNCESFSHFVVAASRLKAAQSASTYPKESHENPSNLRRSLNLYGSAARRSNSQA
jgi:hypothetical protein